MVEGPAKKPSHKPYVRLGTWLRAPTENARERKATKKRQLPLSLLIISPKMGVLGQEGVSTMIICFFERWAQMQNSEELMVSCPLTKYPHWHGLRNSLVLTLTEYHLFNIDDRHYCSQDKSILSLIIPRKGYGDIFHNQESVCGFNIL